MLLQLLLLIVAVIIVVFFGDGSLQGGSEQAEGVASPGGSLAPSAGEQREELRECAASRIRSILEDRVQCEHSLLSIQTIIRIIGSILVDW